MRGKVSEVNYSNKLVPHNKTCNLKRAKVPSFLKRKLGRVQTLKHTRSLSKHGNGSRTIYISIASSALANVS